MTEAMKTAFSTAVETIKSDVLAMMTVALPAGLSIMGVMLALRLGVNFFRSIAS